MTCAIANEPGRAAPAPGHSPVSSHDIDAAIMQGAALRRQGNLIHALAVLKPLVRTHPHHADAHVEWGLTQAAMGLPAQALASLRQATSLAPDHPTAWRALADLLIQQSEPALADRAFLNHARAALRQPALAAAAAAVGQNDLSRAETLLRVHLQAHPSDVAALRMLGDIRLDLDDNAGAADLFIRALHLAPSFTPARRGCATALLQQGLSSAAPHVQRLLASDPADPHARNLHAVLLAMQGDYAAAIAIYQALLNVAPDDARMWLRLGHALRTSGRAPEAVRAYQEAATRAPSLGDAYFSLANLKTYRFTQAEIERMHAQLQSPDPTVEDRFYIEYALGSAYEQDNDYPASFRHYASGAALRRRTLTYDAADTTARFAGLQRKLTQSFFQARGKGGHPDPAPIFIVGLPRAGSTLVEQILASHSQVEGTSELHEMNRIARSLGWAEDKDALAYLQSLANLTPENRRDLGAAYMDQTKTHRRRNRAFFIDKMPGNFIHAGLIHLLLPEAKIVDVRREPMAACFAAFKQLFAHGQEYSYDLREVGLFYRDYAALMAHYDAAMPHCIHRIDYESLVARPEQETRRLLAYCGLAFEESCLRFHETSREVLTASSEQVRQPIFRTSLEQWKKYEPWLGALKEALLRENSQYVGGVPDKS